MHIHANNFCGAIKVDGIKVPVVFEATYIRKDIQDVENNEMEIPI